VQQRLRGTDLALDQVRRCPPARLRIGQRGKNFAQPLHQLLQCGQTAIHPEGANAWRGTLQPPVRTNGSLRAKTKTSIQGKGKNCPYYRAPLMSESPYLQMLSRVLILFKKRYFCSSFRSPSRGNGVPLRALSPWNLLDATLLVSCSLGSQVVHPSWFPVLAGTPRIYNRELKGVYGIFYSL
jgi:hypothetical protein